MILSMTVNLFKKQFLCVCKIYKIAYVAMRIKWSNKLAQCLLPDSTEKYLRIWDAVAIFHYLINVDLILKNIVFHF